MTTSIGSHRGEQLVGDHADLVIPMTLTDAGVAVTVARHAHDRADLAELLDAIGLPSTDDHLNRLARYLPGAPAAIPAGAPQMDDTAAANPPTAPPATPAASPLTAPVLMAWGDRHPTARIRGLAARARLALAELTQAKEREAAVADAEASVERLRKQLARAQDQLRAVKGAPPVAVGAKRSREELAKIRAWAKENGYEVADRGTPALAVIEAYEAAQ